MADVTITGMEVLKQRLSKLAPNMSRTIVEEALMAGAHVFQVKAQINAPKKSGKLVKDIGIRAGSNLDARRAYKEPLKAESAVFIKKRSRHIGRFNEFGTAPHVINARGKVLAANGEILGKTVKHPGQPARPFMRPAFETEQSKAIAAVKEYITVNLDRIVEETKRGV